MEIFANLCTDRLGLLGLQMVERTRRLVAVAGTIRHIGLRALGAPRIGIVFGDGNCQNQPLCSLLPSQVLQLVTVVEIHLFSLFHSYFLPCSFTQLTDPS